MDMDAILIGLAAITSILNLGTAIIQIITAIKMIKGIK